MKLSIEHNLSKDKAIKCAKELLAELSEKQAHLIQKPVQLWSENECQFSLKVRGAIVKGNIVVESENINITAKLPISLNLFKWMIIDVIKNKTIEIVERCKDTTS